jgi:hypothetical protein
MSHYTVGVVVDGKYSLEELDSVIRELMSPFNENLEVKPYIVEYKIAVIESALRGREEDKNLIELLDRDEEEFDQLYPDYNKNYIRERYNKIKDMTEMELYEEIISRENTDNDGNIISTYNPESKWDWYQIGGRWHGMLATKSETDMYEYEGTDIARFKNINFELTKYFKNDFESKEDLFRRYRKDKDIKNYIDSEYGSLEKYIEEIEKPEALTYAMLIDGEWIEPGKVGWFGTSNAGDESRSIYNEKIIQYLESKKDSDDWLIIVDCHI